MAGNKIKVYWIFLLVLLYTGGLMLSVGQTQARYDSTAVTTTILKQQATGIFSDCMVGENDPAVTVLLGELCKNEVIKASFWLESVGADAEGEIAWGVSDPEDQHYADYLNISLRAYDAFDLEQNEKIQLLSDEKMELMLTIEPTSDATDTVHEMMKINVIVTWNQEMWGTFQVILPEVKAEKPIEEEDSTEEGDPGEESSEGEEPTDENTERVELTEEPEENENPDGNEAPGDDEDPDENADPDDNEDLDGNADPDDNEDPGEDEDPDDEKEQDTTEPTVEPTVSPEEEMQLKTLPSFNPEEALSVFLRVTEDITYVRLGTQTTVDGEPLFQALPDGTKLSLDGGESYYLMYSGHTADFDLRPLRAEANAAGGITPTKEITLLLDFSCTKLKWTQPLVLAAEVYNEENLEERLLAETMPNGKRYFQCSILPNAGTGAIPEDKLRSDKRILSRDYYMELTFPLEWEDVQLEYAVEILTMTEEGTLEYREAALSEDALSATYTKNDENHKLELKIGKILPLAGTYRLNMNWTYKGVCFKQTQTTFFINYSAYLDKDLSSQEVQTND